MATCAIAAVFLSEWFGLEVGFAVMEVVSCRISMEGILHSSRSDKIRTRRRGVWILQ